MNHGDPYNMPGARFTVALTIDQHELVQRLFERCSDYAVLHDGEPFGPTAAIDEFTALPPGRDIADKFVYGVAGDSEPPSLEAVLESVRGYPNERTWWLGLLLVDPPSRSTGVGGRLYEWFEQWVEGQGFEAIALSVIDDNPRGQAFWRRQGFGVDRVIDSHRMGTKQHKVHVMSKRLAASPG
jgi:GNAT superfamily N-acetyltransferase